MGADPRVSPLTADGALLPSGLVDGTAETTLVGGGKDGQA